MLPRDYHQLPSTFRASAGLSIKFPCVRRAFCLLQLTFVCPKEIPLVFVSVHTLDHFQLLSTFCMSTVPSINFCQLFAATELSINSVNFLGIRLSYHHLSGHPRKLHSTFFNFLHIRRTSVSFRQLSVRQWELCEFPSAFRLSVELPSTYVNFPFVCGNFRPLPSTFRASPGPSVNFNQLSMPPRKHLSTICASAGPSVIFRELSVNPRDITSTTIGFWMRSTISTDEPQQGRNSCLWLFNLL